MEPHPYREPSEAPHSPERPDPEVGPLRATHAVSLRTLIAQDITALVALVAAIIAAAIAGDAWLFAIPAVLILFAVFTAWSLRDRRAKVHRHADGLVIERAGMTSTVPFAAVDEVWFELAVTRVVNGDIAGLEALRLVEHDRATHRVPLCVDGALDIARDVLRRCTQSLAADARSALANGESLRFGPVELDSSGITIGAARRAWDELKLVRLQPGRVAFCGSTTFWPWRTVRLNRVPHPTLFAALVASLARRVERDDPWAALIDSG